MKNILLASLIVISMSFSVYAKDASSYIADHYLDGHGFDIEVNHTDAYALGCIETLYFLEEYKMHSLYPNCTRGNILQALRSFYLDNPSLKNKPIIVVLRDGCKDL